MDRSQDLKGAAETECFPPRLFKCRVKKRVDKMLNALRLKSTVLGLELGSTRIKAVF